MILPSLGSGFAWRATAAGPALVCTALEEIARHLFTTRPWTLGASRDAGASAWAEIAAALDAPPDSLVRLHQVHGRHAVVADTLLPDASLPDADIVVAGERGRAIAVIGADCVPLLLADRRTGCIGAAHAGWRGMALGVPGVVVRQMGEVFGSRPEDLVAAIGPSIGSCCYEVGGDVRRAFAAAGFSTADVDRWFLTALRQDARNPSMPGLTPTSRPGHWYFDGWSCVRDQLTGSGLDASQLFCAELCTASHPAWCCSYRRDGVNAGRIAGAISACDVL